MLNAESFTDDETYCFYVRRCKNNKRFWVLPCCFFDFYAKYERSQSTNGQYHDYLSYVKSIGQQCDFDVETDVMRIPSTKRVCKHVLYLYIKVFFSVLEFLQVCFVGMKTISEEPNHEEMRKKADQFVEKKFQLLSNRAEKLFVPRPAKIEVRNCTKIHRNIINEVVTTISTYLLSLSNEVETVAGKSKSY